MRHLTGRRGQEFAHHCMAVTLSACLGGDAGEPELERSPFQFLEQAETDGGRALLR
jgi:hypothetical protein